MADALSLVALSQGPMLQHKQGRGPMSSLVALVQGLMPQHVLPAYMADTLSLVILMQEPMLQH